MAYPYDFPDQKPLRYRPRRKVKAKLPFPFLGVDNTPDGIKILAQMPGVIGLVDPALLKTISGTVQTMRCRVTGAVYTSTNTADTLTTVGKGKMITHGATQSGYRPDSRNTIVLPQDRWSVIFAVKPYIAAGLQYIFGPPTNPVGAADGARLSIGMNANKLALFDHQPGSASRTLSATTFATDAAVVCAITFSVENGVHMYINGTLDTTDAAETGPLSSIESDRMFQIGAYGDDQSLDFRGGLGLAFIAEEDYSDTRFDTSRDLITNILKDRYNVV